MKRRNEIRLRYKQIQEEINALKDEAAELMKEHFLLSDDEQWYTEVKRTVGRGKKKHERLEGRINWKENFKDEDTGDVITLDRCRIVRINGEWV